MTKHKWVSGLLIITVLILVGVGGIGCVSVSAYKALQDKYERDTTGLNTHVEELGKANEELTKEKETFSAKLKMNEADNERLKQELNAHQEAMAQLDENIVRKLRELEEPGVTPTPTGVEYQEEALFASGSADLKTKGKEALEKLAGILKTEPNYYVRIDGHTDNEPIAASKHQWTTGSNFELAAYRALKVLLFLEEKGVDPGRMYLVSFGEYHPMTPNDSPENKAKNRRVAISVHKMTPAEQPAKEEEKKEQGKEEGEEGTGEPRK